MLVPANTPKGSRRTPPHARILSLSLYRSRWRLSLLVRVPVAILTTRAPWHRRWHWTWAEGRGRRATGRRSGHLGRSACWSAALCVVSGRLQASTEMSAAQHRYALPRCRRGSTGPSQLCRGAAIAPQQKQSSSFAAPPGNVRLTLRYHCGATIAALLPRCFRCRAAMQAVVCDAERFSRPVLRNTVLYRDGVQ